MAVTLDITSQMRFGDPEGMKEFALAHRIAHDLNANAIALSKGAAIPGFDIGDERVAAEWVALMAGKIEAPTKGMRDWLTLHSLVHQAEFDALGFGIATNIIDVNFADQGQFSDWMLAHQQLHDQVGDALGIA